MLIPSFTGIGNLVYKIETENLKDNFSKNKEMFDFSGYSAKSKYCDKSKALFVCKAQDETCGIAYEEFFRLKRKMNSIQMCNSSKYKKTEELNKDVVAKINHNAYKNILLN